MGRCDTNSVWEAFEVIRTAWLRSALAALIALCGAVLIVSGISWAAPSPLPLDLGQIPPLFCRFGYAPGVTSISNYVPSVYDLRAGWYLSFGTAVHPPRPDGMETVQTVFVKQLKQSQDQSFALYDATAPYVVPYTYTVRPDMATIKAAVLANPGSTWLIGNEIERRDFLYSDGVTSGGQQEILPEVYAWAYHDLYALIKSVDSTAQVGIGGMIQATPLRLKYLDRIWDEYLRRYNAPLPADVWNIHAYTLQEVKGSWGADIPAGLTETTGLVFPDNNLAVLADKDFRLASQHIRALRQWMHEHGQQNKPLIVSEAGVHMPEWIGATINGKVVYPFMPEDIRDSYMYPMFNFAQNVTDTVLGYPADGYRLTQRWIWYSLDGDYGWWDKGVFYQSFGSNLYYSGKNGGKAMGITPLGTYWRAYLNNPISMPVTVDLTPVQVWTDSPATVWDGTPVTMTVYVQVANSGSVMSTSPFSVTIQSLDDNSMVGQPSIKSLGGCGQMTVVTATWTNLGMGAHRLSVMVDSGNVIAETDRTNNYMEGKVLVASQRMFLPVVTRNG